MEIDVVYTWVNGADEAWRLKKLQYLHQYNRKVSDDALSDGRFMDNEELRYSLRSVFTYAPWVKNIYIVTDNQIPEWFESNCTRAKIIDHKEIFKNYDFLPTFNSMAIESNLHHILALSEHFLYFNDDVFLGQCCTPKYFFSKDGKPHIFVNKLIPQKMKWHMNADKLPDSKKNEAQNSVINSRVLIKKAFGKNIYSDFRHGVKACRKTDLFLLEEMFNQQLSVTRSHKFRDNNDILLHALFSMYSLMKGTGKRTYVPNLLDSRRLNILRKKLIKYSYSYVNLLKTDIDKRLALIEKNRPFMFCINQYHDSPESNIAKIRPFLEKYFPHPSPAEKRNI